MATIELSPNFALNSGGYISRMTGFNIENPDTGGDARTVASQCGLLSNRNAYSYGVSGITQLYIMKGTVPTDFSTLTSYSSRSADILNTYTATVTGALGGSTSMQDFSPSNALAVNPITLATNYVNATASGVATWFWWVSRGKLINTPYLNTSLWHQIVGTIGTIGSGADLEIPDTNIVAGVAYRVSNLRMQFPTSWTF